MRQITDFSQEVFSAVAAPDGSYFVVAGLAGENGRELIARAFDGKTGNVIFPNGTKLSRMFFVEYDFAQLVAGLFHHGVLFWSAFADSGFNAIRTLPIYQQLQGCLTHVGGG